MHRLHGTSFRPTWEDYQRVKSEVEKDENPGSAVFLLADASLLFWQEQGFPWIERVKCELPTRDLTVDGKEPAVKAAYVGCCNGDNPELYEVFLTAMALIDVADCMHVHAVPSSREKAHLEQSDIVLLAGGDIKAGWRALEDSYLGEAIKWRLYSGACLIGVAEGATLLGAKAWYKFAEEDEDLFIFRPLNVVPLIVCCNDPHDEVLRGVVEKVGYGAVGMGIPATGGVIFNTDGAFEPVKTAISEIHYPWEKKAITTSLIFPPEKGEGIVVAMDKLRRREAKYGPRAPTTAPQPPDDVSSEESEDESVDAPAKQEAQRLRLAGNDLFKAGDAKGALAAYREALRCDTYNPDLYTNIALCCTQLDKLEDAIAACNRALELSGGDNAKAWYRRGMAHAKAANHNHAHFDFREALQLTPEDRAVERQKDITADKLREMEKEEEAKFKELIAHAGELSTLSLEGQGLGPQGAKLLARCLRADDTVMALHLQGCHVRSYGAEMLGQVLRVNDRLTELDLSGNAVRHSGMKALSEGLGDNKMLAFLDLSCNNICDRGMEAFAECLKRNTALREIRLAHNRITFTGARLVAAALKANDGLEKLNLAGNRLGAEAVWRFVSATDRHPSLQQVDLRGFRVSSIVADSVAEKTKAKRCQLLLGPLGDEKSLWPLF